nr:MAG TPA: hypothetical protein [Caudoviricetes sp.]
MCLVSLSSINGFLGMTSPFPHEKRGRICVLYKFLRYYFSTSITIIFNLNYYD